MALEFELKKLGFSDKEAKVYLALLELGASPVQPVSEKAGVNRATTYVVLETLRSRGAASTVEKEGKTMFIAESPRTLLRLFRAQEQELKEKQEAFKKVLPELEAVFNIATGRPKVKFFEGPEGVRAVREDILQSGAKILYDIYSLEYVNQIMSLFSEEEVNEYVKRQQEAGMTIKSLYTSETGPSTEFKLTGERKFLPKEKFPIAGDILIYEDRVSLTTLRGRIMSVIIESKEIADTMRLVFDLAWLGADHI